MNRRPAIFAVFLLLSFTAASRSQVLTWNDISGPQGYSSFYELGDGTLFAIDDEAILYRSFDGGDSWESVPRPAGPILEFAARADIAMIAVLVPRATNIKQYFSSTDRGDSWTRIFIEPQPVHVSLMLSADGTPHALYPAGSKLAVERFGNGTWQRLGVPSGVYSNPPSGPPSYTVSALDESGAIYIGSTADGIHSTRDNGQTWTKTLSYFRVESIAFSPGGRVAIGTTPNGRTVGGVFTSGDRGATWAPAGLTDTYMAGLQFNLSGDLLALGARAGWNTTGIYRLNAGSAGWDSTEQFDFAYRALHVTGAGKFIASTPGLGLLVSTDDGATWHSDGIRQQDLYSVTTAPDGSILAGTIGAGLFRTTDSGYKWSRVSGPDQPFSYFAFAVAGARILAGTEKGLFGSDDNGLSWSLLSAALNPGTGEFQVYAVLADAGGGLFIGTGAGVFRSQDGGVTWTPAGLGSSTVLGLAPSPDGLLYAATGTEGIFSSSDGGASWISRGLVQPDIQTVGVSEAGRVFVGAASGLYYSNDAGATWTRKIFTYGHVHSILFNGDFNIFAGSSDGLFSSLDGGQSWSAAGLAGQFVISLAYDQYHTITAGIYKGGVARTSEVITGVTEGPGLPSEPSLARNYPNPFNPTTAIEYSVAAISRVTLRVYDILGRVSETLVSGQVTPGSYRATWDGSDRPSGVYFYVITIVPDASGSFGRTAAPFTQTRKMLLVK